MGKQAAREEDIEEAERRIAGCRAVRSAELNLSSLELRTLPESVRSLFWLRRLYISNNPLRELPRWIGELRELDELVVSESTLQTLPTSIGALRKLEVLNVRSNNIAALPAELRSLPNLRVLSASSNPRLGLPPEVADSIQAYRILDYYFRTAAPGGRRALNEFKLILVGRGGVGKTTLVHRLVTGTYKQFKRTPGVNITKWPVTIDEQDIRAHIWDFGGKRSCTIRIGSL